MRSGTTRFIECSLLACVSLIILIGESQEDPFGGERDPIPIHIRDERSDSPSAWRNAFGLRKWSLDDWPAPAKVEVRLFVSKKGSQPYLIRFAKCDEETYWIEKRSLSGISEGHWGFVVSEESHLVSKPSDAAKFFNELESRLDIFAPLSEFEISVLGRNSLWMVEFVTRTQALSTILLDAESITDAHHEALSHPADLRDFTGIVEYMSLIESIFANSSI